VRWLRPRRRSKTRGEKRDGFRACGRTLEGRAPGRGCHLGGEGTEEGLRLAFKELYNGKQT